MVTGIFHVRICTNFSKLPTKPESAGLLAHMFSVLQLAKDVAANGFTAIGPSGNGLQQKIYGSVEN